MVAVCNYTYDSKVSFIAYLICYLRGISIGKGSKFFGYAKFYRAPGSVIQFGKKCRIRSRKSSNLIGINHQCIISTHSSNASIKVGNYSGFSGTTIGCFTSIIIGDNVNCGANTVITDGDWHMDDPRVGPAKPIVIGNRVWLGYGVVVLKGVSIGENSIIGAGSVVTQNIPANVIAAGNPCKIIKHLNE